MSGKTTRIHKKNVPPLEQTEETGPKTAAGVKSEQMGAQGKLKKEQVEQGAEDILAKIAKTKAVLSLLRRDFCVLNASDGLWS